MVGYEIQIETDFYRKQMKGHRNQESKEVVLLCNEGGLSRGGGGLRAGRMGSHRDGITGK